MERYLDWGATAIELGFAFPHEMLDFNVSDKCKSLLSQYDVVTIHAPWKEIEYNGMEAGKVINQLKRFGEMFDVRGVVLHPNRRCDFNLLEKSGLPFMMENMDIRKTDGISPEYFEKLRDGYNFGFVFDVQHGYEHDYSMVLSREILEVMGERLSHLHVSGCNSKLIHAPVHLSDNRAQVMQVLLDVDDNVPRILEGVLSNNVSKMARKELGYLKKNVL